MRNILGARGLAVLRACATDRPLVAFDFDGTLAPIVRRPDRARPRRRTRELLVRLARQIPCAILTGRARADVISVFRRLPLLAVVGNHGAEASPRSRPPRVVARWRVELGLGLAGLAGVWIEDKRFSISVHYRRSRRKAAARRVIWRVALTLRGASICGGHDVVNITPRGAFDKGRALDRLRRASRRDRVIYVGDDVTDEAAFARARAAGGLAIRVGRARASRAAYFVRSQRNIDALLVCLVHASTSPAPEQRR